MSYRGTLPTILTITPEALLSSVKAFFPGEVNAPDKNTTSKNNDVMRLGGYDA